MNPLPIVLALFILGFFGAPFVFWAIVVFCFEYYVDAPTLIKYATLLLSVVFILRPIRRNLISRLMMIVLRKLKLVPVISTTEKEAIEAGHTWVETEFFKGNPNLKTLMTQALPKLSADEKAFISKQVDYLCSMIDDWNIWKTRDIPPEVWAYIRNEKFLGLIIPKESGGLGFSPYAHSEIIKKIASKSFVVAIYVMVPNSLGPAELILRYGTDEQKTHYLPRLAAGIEIPCFGLTEVTAGSDAGNMKAEGVLFKKDGEIFIRLHWDKRYISLAKISTLIGLAFHLKDPDQLLSNEKEVGITCALIPSATPGITLDRRHDPLGVPFYNCPLHGRDVVIPLSAIVGGREGAGKGWKMLMECLAAGRGISFPAQMAGSSQLISRVLFSYSDVREQFGVSLNQFEGVQKPLSEIFAFTYLIEALRIYTLSALHQGLKPATIASISKYYSTEYSRKITNHAMDEMGGSAISLGPRNKIAPYYIAAPISITVEGANILTRSLMIFGQGAFRAHPFAFGLIDSLEKNDLIAFDRSIFNLIGHGVQNFCRMILLTITRGWLAQPFAFNKESKYYRRMSWASASFAFFTDLTMGSIGGKLKFKEAITGRLADILSNLYLAAAVLNKFEAEGKQANDWPLADYALQHLFCEIETAFQGIFMNFPVWGLSTLLKYPVLWWSRLNPIGSQVTDIAIQKLLKTMEEDPSVLQRMSRGIYEPEDKNDYLVQLELACELKKKVKPLLKALKAKGVLLSHDQELLIQEWQAIQLSLLQVDDFNEEEYHGHSAT